MPNYFVFGISLACYLMAGTAGRAADVTPLLAQDPNMVEAQDGWTFTFAPYFWGTSISGDTAQFSLPSVHIDADFGDILDHLDFAAMAAGEARYDRFSIIGDIEYATLSVGASTPLGILASDVEVATEMFTGLVGAGYSVLADSSGYLDIVAGIKVWSVDTTISFSGGLLDGVERSDSATWVDGLAGIRGRYSITPEVYITGWGLVGGGGADLDWDVALALGYNFNERLSVIAGYRAAGVDYSDDGFVFDVVQQGPILSLALRF
ncbi:hypothetical protein [Neorhizobium phenanthreniclasticum]